jgi:ribose transport system permease protein
MKTKFFSVFQRVETLGIYLALVVLVIFFAFTNDAFLTASNFLTIVRQVTTLGIMAVGMTMIMLTGGVDLSVGAQVSIIGITIAHFMVNLQMNPVLATLLGILLGLTIGLVNGIIVTRTRIPPLIATLGMMQIVKGLSFLICSGIPIFGFPEGYAFIGQGRIGIIPFPIIILLIALLVGSFVLNKTVFGRNLYAIGSNAEATRLSGVNVKQNTLLVYIIGALFTAVAAVITLSRINAAQPITGIGTELDVLTATVLGGVSFTGGDGRISGVLAGVLILGVLSNGMVMAGLNEYLQLILKGLVLLFALSMDSLKQRSA